MRCGVGEERDYRPDDVSNRRDGLVMKRLLLALWCAAVLAGCGGGGGTTYVAPLPQNPPYVVPPGMTAFWAVNLTTNTPYQTSAAKVAEGVHCYVYLEQGMTVSQATIDAIRDEFDTNIYPHITAAFGAEPNPGVDNDPKLYILLLNIRDGFSYPTSPTYIAGYYDPNSEYLTSQYVYSNQKEIFFMNVNPALGHSFAPGSTDFYRVLAHEFQHMVHWEQKTHQRGVMDDTWLDEGMAQVAQTYCGYGADYDAVYTFENAPSNSLTVWNDTVDDYGVVYMWAQYYKDRVGSDIFFRMLHNSLTGIASVNSALSAAGYPKDFTGTFRDWAVANYYGDGTTVSIPAGHAEWSYTSINTWPGTHNGILLPGLFPASRQNLLSLSKLDPWSLGFYSYTPGTPPTGSVAWTPNVATEKGTLVDAGSGAVTYDMTSGVTYGYTTQGYLMVQNPTGSATPGGDTVVRTSVATTAQLLVAANASPSVRAMVAETGKPQRIDIGPSLRDREKGMRAQGMRPQF